MRLQKSAKRQGPAIGGPNAFRELIGGPLLKKLFSKFSDHGPEDISCALEEVIRYLQLSAASPSSIFFPGDKLTDDLWHALIVETAEYRELCDKIRPGCFIDHSGMIYEDYLLRKSPAEQHEEQMSWLVSYVGNFGHISADAFRHLKLAQSLCERMNVDLGKLNALADAILLRAREVEGAPAETLAEFLKGVSAGQAALIGRDARSLKEAFHGAMAAASESPMTNAELESVFSVSTALGFTIWQHLAAMERLAQSKEWRAANPEVWEKLRKGGNFAGLATTHLAKAGDPSVHARRTGKDEIVLTGTLPWVTGHGIFTYLLVGFRLDDELVFALVDFPGSKGAPDRGGADPQLVELGCLEGTATVSVKLDRWAVRESQIVGRRPVGTPPPGPASAYRFPDLGIAIAALSECERLLKVRGGKPSLTSVRRIRARIAKLRAAKAGPAQPGMIFKKDECIRDSVRLLALCSGGRALTRDSLAFRLQQEVLLLDAVIQPPETRKLKIEKVAHG